MSRCRMLAIAVIIISGAIAMAVASYPGLSSLIMVSEPSDMPQPPDTTTFEPDVTGPAAPVSSPAGTPYSDPATPRDATMRHNAFAVDMYRQIVSDTNQDGKNVFFSPFSMYMAFSFLYEGARGETAAQMERVFGFYSDEKARHEHVAWTISSINRDDPDAALETANALWLNEWFVPYDTYTSIVRGTYLADIETLDFGGDVEGSVERINGWAANKTNDKITEIVYKSTFVPFPPAAILNNAIYFKGTWVKQFDPETTMTDAFWTTDTARAEADFMQNQAFFNYTESDGVQVLLMPYEGDRLSMLVFLPSERNDIEHLENTLSAEKIDAWRQQLQSTDIVVSIPKFKAETEYSLVDYLTNLGMPSAFDKNDADFSGIVDLATLHGNLYVDDAYQNAFVDVNEEGTEAAAVTTIILMTEEAPLPPLQFIANHPFIFAIQDDESGAILFMGRFSAPDTT